MKRFGAGLLLSAACLLPAGCASIMTGSSQMVEVHSVPSGASIQMDGIHVGTTPRLLKVRRGNAHTLMVYKEGLEPQTVSLGTEFNYWFLGNIALGLLPGIVDVVNGAWMWATPTVVSVTLEVKPAAPPPAPETPKPAEKQ